MSGFIVRRLLIAVPVLLGITAVAFAALSLAPGDPITSRIDPGLLAQMDPAQIQAQRRELGLDQPGPIRYLRWLVGVTHGELGYSVVTRRAIADELALRLPATLQLMGAALIIGLVVGLPFGVISAVTQYSRLDYALTAFSMTMISAPTFFIGLAGIYVFGVYLHVLPTADIATFGEPFSIGDRIRHLLLPASILGLANAAPLMRYTRASVLEVLRREYMTTARAKGLPPWVILVRHGLRNALLPIITVVGLLLPELVAGAVVTEQIFAWPGMGTLAVRAASDRDPASLMGVVLVVGIGVLVSNLLADVAYAVADPRIRYT
jgi:peptide/nickel transport system permease protein